MPALTRRAACMAGLLVFLATGVGGARAQDALPSWNDGSAKQAIVAFVRKVTQPGADFVPPDERVATFDNDGTLWAEQPIYFEAMFAFDQVKALAAADPSLRDKPPFRAVLQHDQKAMAAFTDKDVVQLIAATHSGMTTEAFDAAAKAWFAAARHPRFNRTYASLVYQPQLELLSYLRANGFKTYIVSGGGVDFMRAYAQQAYGIPPEQVIGSSGKTRFEIRDDRSELVKLPQIDSVDDKEGKVSNIGLHIGRRPILAFGNSDGDLAMLMYAAGGDRPNLELLVHHDDADREYVYDRASKIGTLDKAWDEAKARGWVVVSMKKDWRVIFPPITEDGAR